jgi:hypothetical protein
MHKSTSLQWQGIRVFNVLSGLALILGIAAAIFVTASPARAADLARQPDLQVAVFIVPLALLFALLLFEVARYVWRGKLPAEAPSPPNPRALLTVGHHAR